MSQNMTDKKILITGGGSGGHISAAMAIIDGLRQRYPDITKNILYVGGDLAMEGELSGLSLEEKIICKTDIPFKRIRAGKLQRYLSFSSLTLLLRTFGGFFDARKVIKEFKPDLLISTGGYVTVPVCIAASLSKVPVYIHEQTAASGLANRISAKFAKRVYTTFAESKDEFPSEKVLHVGNAIRNQIFDTYGAGEVVDALSRMEKDIPIVFIAGGGQGSHLLNRTVQQMLRYAVEEFQIVLQTGDNTVHRDYEMLLKEQKKLPSKHTHRFYPVKFIDSQQMGALFDKTDLYVGRSGANFVYELAVLKIPSLLIPIPWVTNNEQHKNAEILVNTGLGKILPEGEVTAERLYQEIQKYLKYLKDGKLNIDENRLRKHFPTDAVDKILDDLNI